MLDVLHLGLDLRDVLDSFWVRPLSPRELAEFERRMERSMFCRDLAADALDSLKRLDSRFATYG